MDKIKVIIITLLVTLLFSVSVYLGQSKKSVLVIHSYNANSEWVKQINRGIDSYLSDEVGFADEVSVDYYYMDMESPVRQKCETILTEIRNTQKLLEDRQPNMVVISDDIAQRLLGVRLAAYETADNDFLSRNAEKLIAIGNCSDNQTIRESLLSEMVPLELGYEPKVIFVGITEDAEEYGYQEARNVTGIFQHPYLASLQETVQDIYRAYPEEADKPSKVMLLGDTSGMAKEEKLQMPSRLRTLPFDVPLEWGEIIEVSTWDEWKETVLSANQEQAMLILTGYANIAKGRTEESIVKWTETCASYPVVGETASFVDTGGMLAVTVSGQEQGQVAMALANQWLERSETAGKPEWREPQQFTVGLNKSLFEKRGLLNFPLVYESYSRESNSFRDFLYEFPSDCQ